MIKTLKIIAFIFIPMILATLLIGGVYAFLGHKFDVEDDSGAIVFITMVIYAGMFYAEEKWGINRD
ncbi:hypothetical protein [Sulfurovum sp.]|uniref:hypothetical protein n=1 Tax=Sulfurovum sp. TaxID=1969726 RepID=UPI003569095B